jgi:predicted ATPase
MKLLRIQVPDFRVLKDVDIQFEKEFSPSIFPLGSLNGGGKSTLLQLIFGLLHCSSDSERIPFLQNLLYGFQVPEDSTERVLAIIDIWDGSKVVQLKFIACKDSYVRKLLKSSNLENNDEKYLKFSVSVRLEENQIKINNIEEKIKKLDRIVNRLEKTKKIENEEKRFVMLRDILLEEKDIVREERELKIPVYSLRVRDMQSIEETQEELKETLEVYKLNFQSLCEERQQLEKILQKVLNFLQNENLTYICNYSSSKHEAENKDNALLCHIDNLDMTESKSFMKELSQKIFLAAPSTQIFLFLSQKSRKLLLRQNNNEIESYLQKDYYSQLNLAKYKLSGFFTYDFIALDVLIKAFIDARDQDFRTAIETGEYGNSYKTILHDLNLIMGNKKINLDTDFSGIRFKIDRDGEQIELYPEDLSHGELKKLSIYMWMRYHKIKDAIVLMDEIEIAFHPDWQYQIVADLIQWAPSNQYILATHSYELCQALTPAHVKELEPRLLKPET